MDVTRRTFTRTVAWGAPVVGAMGVAPAFAASTDPITGIVDGQGSKCPGQSTDDPNTVIISFFIDPSYAEAFETFRVEDIQTLTVNNVAIPIQRIVVEGNQIHVVTVPRENSADASGRLIFEYTIYAGTAQQRTFKGDFTYSGTHPNQNLCKRI